MQCDDKPGIRILIVEDVASMRGVIMSMLRSLGYRDFGLAEDGRQAWDRLEKEKFDLIISDWQMPNMTGIELLHKLRERSEFEDLPFIMITGEIDEASVSLAVERDVDAYLIKPTVPKLLEEKIHMVMERKNNPSEYQKLLDTGRKRQKEADFREAIQSFNTAIGLRPDNALGHLCLGQAKEEIGMWNEAKSAYEKALSLNPKYLKALDSVSRIYTLLGEKEDLFRTLITLNDISPNNIDRQLKLAEFYFESGDKEKAKSCLFNALKLKPNDEKLIFKVAQSLFHNDFIDQADPLFEKLLRKNPESTDYLYYIGELFMRKRQFDKARSVYLKSLSLQETEIIHLKLAQLYIHMGSKRLASHHLESAMLVNPQLEVAERMLKRLDQLIDLAKKGSSS